MTPSTINALLICLGMYTVNSSVNVAFMKPTWMSSGLDGDIRPELVVDGILIESWIHTGHEEFPRWWVNLTQNYTLARINIYYRTSWGRRMTGYKLIVSNTESTHPWNRGHQIEGHICRTETRSEPPVQQTVPCLTRGSFITYADDQTYTNDPNPFVELSELEAFGCVTGLYGQGNCEEQCPEGCWDGVCNPDNGTCFTGCKSGLQGQTCNKSCDHGSFGLGCQQSCFCLNDTCDPENGICPTGRCQRGWNGIACDQPCDHGSFGLGCQQSCFCLNDTCDPEYGTCPTGRCQRGWNGTACDERCCPRTFGHNCEETCHCRLGSCDPVDGTCLYEGCDQGWQTESCSEDQKETHSMTKGFVSIPVFSAVVGPLAILLTAATIYIVRLRMRLASFLARETSQDNDYTDINTLELRQSNIYEQLERPNTDP